jgi:hypothetical protein
MLFSTLLRYRRPSSIIFTHRSGRKVSRHLRQIMLRIVFVRSIYSNYCFLYANIPLFQIKEKVAAMLAKKALLGEDELASSKFVLKCPKGCYNYIVSELLFSQELAIMDRDHRQFVNVLYRL